MRPSVVVPLDSVANGAPRLLERLKRVLPDTLFFQAPKKPFEYPVLLRRIGRDELLPQAIVAAGLSESPTLEDRADARTTPLYFRTR